MPSPTPRGKGDYYRLGHGDDSHQRTPKRVMGPLAHERVVDMACGSLHCVVCTASGHIFTWGDNDEGQIGNDTTQPVKSPMVHPRGGGVCVQRVWECVCRECGSVRVVSRYSPLSEHHSVGARLGR